jgi:uncharacterized membrane protein YeaQ/YmgE (transglycosylase-associated protein family)
MFTILGWILFGAFVGWLATLIMGKRGGGCMVNIALGLVGALAGGACSAPWDRASTMTVMASSSPPWWR